MAKQYVENFQFNRGDDWFIPVTLTYNGAATSIADFKFRFTLKDTVEDPDVDALYEADNQGGTGITITDEDNGKLMIQVPKATTLTLLPGFYIGDLQFTTPDPDAITGTPYKVIIENVADITITEP